MLIVVAIKLIDSQLSGFDINKYVLFVNDILMMVNTEV